MFRKTENNCQLNLFSDYTCFSNKQMVKYLQDERKWFHQFFKLITSKIDEDIFKPLFKEGNMGAPNTSIRQLVAINCLKDGLGSSDEMLFQTINIDLGYRIALGAFSIEDELPSQQTYYLFRRRLFEYENKYHIDLMEQCFNQSSKDFICELNINGQNIRMDSKLIGSNIAWFSRYELVQLMFVKHVTPILESLNPSLRKRAEKIINRDGQKDQYTLDKADVSSLFKEMGIVLQKIVAKAKLPEDHILRRLLDEQYNCQGEATPKDKAEISASSIQSPYDTDATYRKKGEQQVKGFSTNITETLPEGDKPSIILNACVKNASAADNDYYQDAITQAEEITNQKVNNVYADGAYQSESNREFSKQNGITLYTCGLQGREGRYDYFQTSDEEVTVTDKNTGETFIATLSRTGKNWVFTDSDNNKHYFTSNAIEICKVRKEIENTPPLLMNNRNNVEAGMFQYSFHSRNGKTRYRGLFKHKLHAYARCMWMNYRRTFIYYTKMLNQGTLETC